jgi:hypothetical protein
MSSEGALIGFMRCEIGRGWGMGGGAAMLVAGRNAELQLGMH